MLCVVCSAKQILDFLKVRQHNFIENSIQTMHALKLTSGLNLENCFGNHFFENMKGFFSWQ